MCRRVDLRLAGPLVAAALLAGCGEVSSRVVAVTFNTGTTPSLGHDRPPDDGYGARQAALSDEHYGNGLAWVSAIEDTARFFAEANADIVGLQEIFSTSACPEVPEEARAGFVCAGWQPGSPTVASRVLGAGYQVVCHPGRDDKCLAVRVAFGRFRGPLEGAPLEGCGRGARVARGVIDRVEGPPITVVHVHGTSGFAEEDVRCRAAQIERAFALAGDRTLLLGDFNTDPTRLRGGDPSADALAEGAARAQLSFHTDVSERAPPTYAGLVSIDHVLSDFATGDCASPPVTEMVYFDHRPQLCALTESPDRPAGGSGGRR